MRGTRLVIVVILLQSTLAVAGPTSQPTMDEPIAALRALGEPVTPADLKTWPTLPDERNAAKVLWGLIPRMRKAAPDGGLWTRKLTKQTPGEYPFPLSTEQPTEVREALDAIQDVLEQIARTSALDGFDWSVPASPLAAKSDAFPHGAFWGACHKALYLDGLLAASSGDFELALERVELLQRLGDAMTTYPGNNDFQPIWPFMYELTVRLAADIVVSGPDELITTERARLKSLAAVWGDDRGLRDAMIRRLQVERVAIIDAYTLVQAEKLQPQQVNGYGYLVSDLLEFRVGVPMWPTVVQHFTGMIDVLRDNGLLYSDSAMRLGEYQRQFFRAGGNGMHVVNQLGPKFSQEHLLMLERRALQKLAATAIAVRLYRVDHAGENPKSLDDLVPRYLNQIPQDPTSKESASIRYLSGSEPIIWTCGQNRTDDGGRERPKGSSWTDRRVVCDEVVRLSAPR